MPARPGLYEGFFLCEQAGAYRIQTGPQDQPHSNSLTVDVSDAGREQMEPALQRQTLQHLADVSGGKYVPVGELPALASLWQDRSQTISLPPEEKPLWNHWSIFVVLLLLAGVMAYGSYYLILLAFQLGGEAAAVTAVRQLAIPLSVILGGTMLREAELKRRLIGAVIVAVGVVLIILSR